MWKMWKNVETPKVHLFPVCSVGIGHSFYFLFEKQDATKINKHSIDAENAEHSMCFHIFPHFPHFLHFPHFPHFQAGPK